MIGYKHKLNYYRRTVSGIGNLLRKVDKVILTKFIPATTGGIITAENDRKLLSLAPRLGGLDILIFEELCELENQNPIIISEHLSNRNTGQFRRHEPDPELNIKKKQIKFIKSDRQKKILGTIRNETSSEERKQHDLSFETGASFWLKTLPINEEGYIPNKQIF